MAVTEAASCHEARLQLQQSPPDAVLLDFSLPDGDGLELLQHFREFDPDIPVIMLTGQGTIETAVRAMSQGARNFLTKPVQLAALEAVLQRELENRRLLHQSRAVASRQNCERMDPFLGASAATCALREMARRVAGSESPVLISGETGSGKGVLAHWLHAHSSRADETFLDLNCAGLTREFLETELFGHEKGAFTGAIQAKPGLLEVADRGSVFLDEIGDMDLQVQPKVLKVLETRQFRRLGAIRDRTVDVRLIAATHRDLLHMVREGRFREDLYYRLNIIPLKVPPLRERLEDIPVLATHFLNHIAKLRGRGEMQLDPSAVESLQRYSWPGNLRELHNVLERAVLIAEHNPLSMHDLQFQNLSNRPAPSSALTADGLTLQQMERSYIQIVLQQECGSMDRAARRLGIARSSLYNKVKRLGVMRGNC